MSIAQIYVNSVGGGYVVNNLELLKTRRPDPKREKMGDADFMAVDYEDFKKKYLGKPRFILIKRPDMEMIELIELMDLSYNAIAYFFHPTLARF